MNGIDLSTFLSIVQLPLTIIGTVDLIKKGSDKFKRLRSKSVVWRKQKEW